MDVTRVNLERWCDRRYQWLFLLSFDLDFCDVDDLMHHAELLLKMSDHRSRQARLVEPGEQIGWAYWNEVSGWHEPEASYSDELGAA